MQNNKSSSKTKSQFLYHPVFITLAFLCFNVSSASAAVITFGDGLQTSLDGYTESGMVASATGNFNRVRDWSGNYDDPNNSGEREILINHHDLTISFSLQSGGFWDFISLDVEDTSNNLLKGGLMRVWDSSLTYDETFDGSSFGTLLFGWSGITTLNIECAGGANTCFAQAILDNIEFSPSVVPVPAAAWLFGTALIGLAGFSRRKKAA